MTAEDTLAPCGLYCATCVEVLVHKTCHGCGCACGECGGGRVEGCEIAQCARSKGLDTCAACDDLPCTKLIQFAYHPFAIHHLPVIEILRRVRRVGKEQVLQELRAYFQDEERRLQWAFLEDYSGRRWAAYQAWKESK